MNNTDFYIRRFHSLLGIVPIGFFLIEHVISISTVLGGPGAFDSTVAKLAAIPHEILLFMETLNINNYLSPFLFMDQQVVVKH